MIPQTVLDTIHDDIDNLIAKMPTEATIFISEHVKSKLDYEHTIDFLYGFEIGKIYRLFSYLMAQTGTGASQAEMLEFAEIVFKRSSEIRQAILKVISPD